MADISKNRSPDRSDLGVALLLAEAINHRAFNRQDEALDCLGRLLLLEPTHVPALIERGMIRMAQGRLDEASECFERALEIDRQDPYAMNCLSMLHREQGNLGQASEWLQQGLELNPHNSHMLNQLSLISYQIGRKDKAAEFLKKAIRYRNVGNQILHQAEILAKYMAPGVVIAGLAHEVRNVLESTNMALDLLRDDLSRLLPQAEGQKVGSRLNRIGSNSERIYHLIQHFREIVKRDRPEPSLIHVSELVSFAFDLLGEKLRNMGVLWEVIKESKAKIPPIYGNRVELEQVFINLISNAYDALIEARSESPRIRIEIAPSSPDPGVEVRVCDNGPGIPEDVAARMFELAFTTKASGTGVGLWLCAFAVERADGEIELADTGPQGTIFKIQFPSQGESRAESSGIGRRR